MVSLQGICCDIPRWLSVGCPLSEWPWRFPLVDSSPRTLKCSCKPDMWPRIGDVHYCYVVGHVGSNVDAQIVESLGSWARGLQCFLRVEILEEL